LLSLALPVLCALVIESDDGGETNLRPPARDPGFAYVGQRGGTSAVYLGKGWVITANHVGPGDFVLGGVTYHAVPDSTVRFGDGGTAPPPDVVAFRIEPRPPLPPLQIRLTPPEVGDRVILIGRGCNRGERITWNGQPGWSWGAQTAMRWGTNRVFASRFDLNSPMGRTPAFALRFDAGETPYETQAATGDSGGAVFIARKGRFELAGVLIAIAGQPTQPHDTALYGNLTTAADLSAFRRPLAALLQRP
jgi:hypothetical protein